MPMAAVPRYLGQTFEEASPGLRFGLYLQVWMSRSDQEKEIRDRTGKGSREGGELAARLASSGMDTLISELEQADRNPLTKCWHKSRKLADQAWRQVLTLTSSDLQRLDGCLQRQRALAEPLAAAGRLLTLDAQSTAPFVTGLGNEHPLENGFAFLNPYGLPYLAGSGVKGVLRTAARELAEGKWDDTRGWSEEAIATLFGSEDSHNPCRGVLSFWDVLPRSKTTSLALEVMTGHQSHYYQKGESPHDTAAPVPVYFLSVPPGAEFSFHVHCNQSRLRQLNAELDWQALLRAAFELAFNWLGFGAKTAVGYGAMEIDRRKEEAARKRAEEEAARRRAEAEEHARQEAAAAEQAARQAAFDALPEEQKLLHQLEELLHRMEALPAIGRAELIEEFNGLRKRLEQEGPAWPDEQAREQGACLLERYYDLVGWAETGIKANKRKKQEQKKRDLIALLRKGG